MQPIDLHQGANADGAAISASVCGWPLTKEKWKIVDVTRSTIFHFSHTVGKMRDLI